MDGHINSPGSRDNAGLIAGPYTRITIVKMYDIIPETMMVPGCNTLIPVRNFFINGNLSKMFIDIQSATPIESQTLTPGTLSDCKKEIKKCSE